MAEGRYLGDDTGSAWSVAEEGEFPEIGALGIVHNLGGLFSGLQDLRSVGLALGQEEEDVAFVALEVRERLAGYLADDLNAGLEFEGLDGVHDFGKLVGLNGAEDLDALQERVVHVALLAVGQQGELHGGLLDDVCEGHPVERPQHTVHLGRDGGSPGSVVQQRQLSKGLSRLVLLEQFGRLVFGLEGGTRNYHLSLAGQSARLDDVQVVALVVLPNDHGPG